GAIHQRAGQDGRLRQLSRYHRHRLVRRRRHTLLQRRTPLANLPLRLMPASSPWPPWPLCELCVEFFSFSASRFSPTPTCAKLFLVTQHARTSEKAPALPQAPLRPDPGFDLSVDWLGRIS